MNTLLGRLSRELVKSWHFGNLPCAYLPPSFSNNSALLNRDECANRCIMTGQENHQTIDGPYYNVTKVSQTGDKRKSEDDGAHESDKKTKRNRYISIAWWGHCPVNKIFKI